MGAITIPFVIIVIWSDQPCVFFTCSWKTSWFAQSTPSCRCLMRRTTWSCPSWRWSWPLTTNTCSSTPRWGTCRKWFWWWSSRSPRPCSRSVDRSLPLLSSCLPGSARHSSSFSSYQPASSPLLSSCLPGSARHSSSLSSFQSASSPLLSSCLPGSARHSSSFASFQSASSPLLFCSCPDVTVLGVGA